MSWQAHAEPRSDRDRAAEALFLHRFGLAVARERTRQRISATELARRLGVCRVTIHRWEAGMNMPTAYHAARIADVLHMPVTNLIEPDGAA